MNDPVIRVSPVLPEDRNWTGEILKQYWGTPTIITLGTSHPANTYPGFKAIVEGKRAGLILYLINDSGCEVISLNSLIEGSGIGSALLRAVLDVAKGEQCDRLRLITTNDNIRAQQFYLNRGFRIKNIHSGAVNKSRILKPSIPFLNENGIPIQDEIEMEISLK